MKKMMLVTTTAIALIGCSQALSQQGSLCSSPEVLNQLDWTIHSDPQSPFVVGAILYGVQFDHDYHNVATLWSTSNSTGCHAEVTIRKPEIHWEGNIPPAPAITSTSRFDFVVTRTDDGKGVVLQDFVGLY